MGNVVQHATNPRVSRAVAFNTLAQNFEQGRWFQQPRSEQGRWFQQPGSKFSAGPLKPTALLKGAFGGLPDLLSDSVCPKHQHISGKVLTEGFLGA